MATIDLSESSGRVLLLEHWLDPQINTVIGLLRRKGYPITLVSTTTQAILHLQADAFDTLIVSDRALRETTAEFVAGIRADDRLFDLPVIVLNSDLRSAERRTRGNPQNEGLSIFRPFDPLEVGFWVWFCAKRLPRVKGSKPPQRWTPTPPGPVPTPEPFPLSSFRFHLKTKPG
ncbi:MAG: hypothetical protein V4671_28185 [Armatimonadota bacterium]